MDPFLTTYRQHYANKIKCMEAPIGVEMEFQNPLNVSYKKYLQLSSSTEPLKPPVENFDKYFKKIEEEKPKIASMHFKGSLNNEIMSRLFMEEARTKYQYDFCDLDKDEEYKELERQRNMFRLPEDSVLPLTTQKYDFRDPIALNSNAYKRTKYGRGPNNLDVEAHIRDIMKITTGASNYMGTIGALGDTVMREHLHGKPTHLQKDL